MRFRFGKLLTGTAVITVLVGMVIYNVVITAPFWYPASAHATGRAAAITHNGTPHATGEAYDTAAPAITATIDHNATAEALPVIEPGGATARDVEPRAVGTATPTQRQEINALKTRVAALESTVAVFVRTTPAPTAAPTSQPSSTPATNPTPTPTPTPHHQGTNPCGLPLDAWWPAVEANGCQNKSERGDAPPTWVKDYEISRGRVFSMHGPNLTGPAESAQKYMVMKGYAGVFIVRCDPASFNFGNNSCGRPVAPRTIDFYGVVHGGSVPFERAGVVHSWRAWFRERDNSLVSAIQGWYEAPGFGFERVCGFDGTDNRNNFPIIFGPSRATFGQGCGDAEQWYVRAFGQNPNIEFGITFVNAVTLKQPNEQPTDYDPSKWDLSGSLGNTRRMEVSYYTVTRADNTRKGVYWASQFGDVVSGPNDARCGAAVTVEGRVYTVICLEQNVSPTLPEISFASTIGGNAFQRTYDATGVVAPN